MLDLILKIFCITFFFILPVYTALYFIGDMLLDVIEDIHNDILNKRGESWK